MRQWICESDRYYQGNEEGYSVALSVEISDLPEIVEVEGETLNLKDEFHVSLVCTGKVLEKKELPFTPEIGKQIVDDFCEFVGTQPVDFVRYTGEFRYCEVNEARTLVVMCEVSNLDAFIDLINDKYGYGFEYQPMHVTLYVKDKGIWLVDADDLERLTKVVPVPEGVLL